MNRLVLVALMFAVCCPSANSSSVEAQTRKAFSKRGVLRGRAVIESQDGSKSVPLTGEFFVMSLKDGLSTFETFSSDQSGRFKQVLVPGSYMLEYNYQLTIPEQPIISQPLCPSKRIRIRSNRATAARIICNSNLYH